MSLLSFWTYVVHPQEPRKRERSQHFMHRMARHWNYTALPCLHSQRKVRENRKRRQSQEETMRGETRASYTRVCWDQSRAGRHFAGRIIFQMIRRCLVPLVVNLFRAPLRCAQVTSKTLLMFEAKCSGEGRKMRPGRIDQWWIHQVCFCPSLHPINAIAGVS